MPTHVAAHVILGLFSVIRSLFMGFLFIVHNLQIELSIGLIVIDPSPQPEECTLGCRCSRSCRRARFRRRRKSKRRQRRHPSSRPRKVQRPHTCR